MGSTVSGVGNFRAAMLGVAYGDGWGYPNERQSYGRLTLMDLRGPELPERLIVSDDTQMTLHLAQALDGAAGKTASELQSAILTGWLAWLHDPGLRGIGRTTRTALNALDSGATPVIDEDNVYSGNTRNAPSFGVNLQQPTIPSPPKIGSVKDKKM